MTFADIVKDIDFILFGNSTETSPYVIADKVRNINNHYDLVADLIMKADGNWEWDDDNKTDLPVATADLAIDQLDYSITDVSFLKILKVELKDPNGNWNPLLPITLDQKRNQTITDYMKTSGTPREYDKLGSSLFLYPKANYAQTASLKVWYQRNVTLFTVSSTTDVPGFDRKFHRLISLGAALDYAVAHGMSGKINIIVPMIVDLERRLQAAYAGRGRDEKVSMTTEKEDYGQSSSEFSNEGEVGVNFR